MNIVHHPKISLQIVCCDAREHIKNSLQWSFLSGLKVASLLETRIYWVFLACSPIRSVLRCRLDTFFSPISPLTASANGDLVRKIMRSQPPLRTTKETLFSNWFARRRRKSRTVPIYGQQELNVVLLLNAKLPLATIYQHSIYIIIQYCIADWRT